jgi:mannose-6-phosphate isomerase-like protein (cupin superfamily)
VPGQAASSAPSFVTAAAAEFQRSAPIGMTMRITESKVSWFAVIVICLTIPLHSQDVMNQMLTPGKTVTVTQDQLKWQRMFSPMGFNSPEIAFVMTPSEESEITQAYIRFHSNSVLPSHNHAVAESIIVVSGQLQSDCQSIEETLKSGTFKYFPPWVEHELKTGRDESATILITINGSWNPRYGN